MRKNELMEEPELDGLFIFHTWALKEYIKYFTPEQFVQLINALINFTETDTDAKFDDPTMLFAFRYGYMEVMDSWDYIGLFAESYKKEHTND